MTILLETKAITKSYHGNIAVDAVDFDLCAGEVHALLGENGAGKSTLSKLLAGVVEPTSGTLIFDGKEIRFTRPADALQHGIAMVFQETSLVPSMTVAQNLYLGDESVQSLARHHDRCPAVPAIAEFYSRSYGECFDAWRCQTPDGGDSACRSA